MALISPLCLQGAQGIYRTWDTQKTAAKTPLTQLHEELLALAESRGYGKADNAAIIEAYRKDTPCSD